MLWRTIAIYSGELFSSMMICLRLLMRYPLLSWNILYGRHKTKEQVQAIIKDWLAMVNVALEHLLAYRLSFLFSIVNVLNVKQIARIILNQAISSLVGSEPNSLINRQDLKRGALPNLSIQYFNK